MNTSSLVNLGLFAGLTAFCVSCKSISHKPENGFQSYRIIEPVTQHVEKARLPELQTSAFPSAFGLKEDMLLVSDGPGRYSLTDRRISMHGLPFTEPESDALGVVRKGTRLNAHRVEVCTTEHFAWEGMSYIISGGEFAGRVVNPVAMAWDTLKKGRASSHDPKFLEPIQ